jgi:hypothetical protein
MRSLAKEAATDRTPGWKIAAGIGAGALGLALLRQLASPEYRLHVAGPDGRVEASPAGLARAAGVSLPAYVLASMMQSEEHSDRGRLAVGRAAWNAVAQSAEKIIKKIIPAGYLGSQLVNSYASSAVAPTARTLQLAQTIIEGRVPDFVLGAVQWDAPAAQDRRHALYLACPARYPKYRWSSEEIAEKRRQDGMREVRVVGVPSTRFWTRV